MTWHQAPFIRLLLPLIVGILLACYFPLPLLGNLLPILFLCLLLPCIYVAWQKKLSVSAVRIGAGLIGLTVFCMGYSLCYWQDLRHDTDFVGHNSLSEQQQSYLARIVGTPKLKESSMQAKLELMALVDSNGASVPVSGFLLASFQLDTFAAALAYGDGLMLHTTLKSIGPPANPHAFDAANYYGNQQIYHQCYLREDYWKPVKELNGAAPLKKALLQWRQYLISIFEQQLAAYPNELAVASALILGERAGLSKDLKNAYSDTGATHVLAVSGLHVGLIALGLGMLLGLFRRKKNQTRKSLGELILLLIGIWFFALLTGASPSVLRAATMFSLISVSQAMERRSSIYNTLAGSAFILLCLQPNILWDIGFQLSYLAVLGIVYLQPLIYKKIFIANKLGDYIWKLTSVSLAAQIATLPISLYYFHQFPAYFWLSGLLVIPLATIIMLLGLLLLFFHAVPILGLAIGSLLYWTLALMNAGVFVIQQLPGAVWDGFWLESWEMLACYVILILILLAIATRKLKWISLGSTLALILVVNGLAKNISRAQEAKIFVYKVYKGTAIDFVEGKNAYTWVDSLHSGPGQLEYVHQNNLWSLGIRNHQLVTLYEDSLENGDLYLSRKGFGQFREKRLACLSPALMAGQLAANQPLPLEYLFLTGNAKIKDLSKLDLLFDYKTLVFDASNSPYRLALWRRQCIEEGIPFVDCSEQGQELK